MKAQRRLDALWHMTQDIYPGRIFASIGAYGKNLRSSIVQQSWYCPAKQQRDFQFYCWYVHPALPAAPSAYKIICRTLSLLVLQYMRMDDSL